MEAIVIKEYVPDYKQEVINLILNIQQNEFQIPITKEDQPDLEDIPKFYQSEGGNFWVATCGNQVVGTLSLLNIGNHQGALRKMFVKTDYRGKKYNTAKLLLQTLLNWSGKHDIHQIYLGTTEKFLAAHRFYEKNGFVLIPKEHLPEAFPVMKVDTRFYKYITQGKD